MSITEDPTRDTAPVLPSIETERECARFLFHEAELLDDCKYLEWYETCLSDDLAYLIPTRTTRETTSGESEFSSVSFHVRDSHSSIRVRVNRMLTQHAWSEDPASRTARMVTNLRMEQIAPDVVAVRNNLMVYRSQWDTTHYDLIVGDRHDELVRTDGYWRLRRRTVYLKHTILGTPNLGIFL